MTEDQDYSFCKNHMSAWTHAEISKRNERRGDFASHLENFVLLFDVFGALVVGCRDGFGVGLPGGLVGGFDDGAPVGDSTGAVVSRTA